MPNTSGASRRAITIPNRNPRIRFPVLPRNSQPAPWRRLSPMLVGGGGSESPGRRVGDSFTIEATRGFDPMTPRRSLSRSRQRLRWGVRCTQLCRVVQVLYRCAKVHQHKTADRSPLVDPPCSCPRAAVPPFAALPCRGHGEFELRLGVGLSSRPRLARHTDRRKVTRGPR